MPGPGYPFGIMMLLLAVHVAPGPAKEEAGLILEAEDAPLSSVLDGVLKKKGINMVYSPSKLGLVTGREPKVTVRVREVGGKKILESVPVEASPAVQRETGAAAGVPDSAAEEAMTEPEGRRGEQGESHPDASRSVPGHSRTNASWSPVIDRADAPGPQPAEISGTASRQPSTNGVPKAPGTQVGP